MADVYDINGSKRIQPLRLINPASWTGKPIPQREWLVKGILVRGGVTLLNGDGGIGKSLLCQQLQTALALGRPWIGLDTPPKVTRSLGIYCEDEDDELHRRQEFICKYYGCSFEHLNNNAFLMSRVGEENTLMRFNRREGGGDVTNFFRQLEATINENNIEVVIIDTVADTFSGMEIDREQVRTFVQRIRSWALRTRGGVIITQHPSVAGMASGSGSSGSTGWHNSVRSRIYLQANNKKDEDGDEIPSNERFLRYMKSNYGPKEPKMRLVWEGGVLKPKEEASSDSFNDNLFVREAMLDAAVGYVKDGIRLSPDSSSRTALVNRLRKDRPALANYPFSALMRTYDLLKEEGELVTTTFKNNKREVETYVRPSWLKYPDEGMGNP